MKHRILFCCFVVATAVVTAFHVLGQERAERPVYQEGECWLFRSVSKNYQSYVSGVLALPVDGNHEICFLEGKFFELEGGAKSEISSASTWNSILYMAENRNLKFPLIIGQKWAEEYKTRVRGATRLERRACETRVLGVKYITTTSAGTYQTFKIERGNWGPRSQLLERWIYFYSPQTKSVVKHNYEALIGSTATRELELIKFWSVR